MPRSNPAVLSLAVLGFALASCRGGTSDPTRPPPVAIPSSTSVDFATVVTDTLSPGESKYFAAALDGSPADLALIFALGGRVGLVSYGGDSTFQTVSCEEPADSRAPKQCALMPTGNTSYLQVRAADNPSPEAFNLFVYRGRLADGPIVSEGTVSNPIAVEAGVPFAGAAQDFRSSHYRAHGVQRGVLHSVVLFGWSTDVARSSSASLSVIGSDIPSSDNGHGAVEWRGVTDSTVDLEVRCVSLLGPSGSRYWVFVR